MSAMRAENKDGRRKKMSMKGDCIPYNTYFIIGMQSGIGFSVGEQVVSAFWRREGGNGGKEFRDPPRGACLLGPW